MLALRNERQQRNPGIMVSATMCSKCLSSPHYVELGAKINTDVFCSILENHILPEGLSWLPAGFVYAQDGAPSHTSRNTHTFFKKHAPEVDILSWPPSSPDLNPLDYGLWSMLEQKLVGRRRFSAGWQIRIKGKINAAFASTRRWSCRGQNAYEQLSGLVEATSREQHHENGTSRSRRWRWTTSEGFLEEPLDEQTKEGSGAD